MYSSGYPRVPASGLDGYNVVRYGVRVTTPVKVSASHARLGRLRGLWVCAVCLAERALKRTNEGPGRAVSHVRSTVVCGVGVVWYWGNFLYKKREFSIQDIIIYHHIS